jgi:hypothetical protein
MYLQQKGREDVKWNILVQGRVELSVFKKKGNKLPSSTKCYIHILIKWLSNCCDNLPEGVIYEAALEGNEWYTRKELIDRSCTSHFFSFRDWGLEEHICYFIICAMMHVWLAAQFFILFGDQTCVVVTSRVRPLIKFLYLRVSSVEIYIHFFCPRRRLCTVVWRKSVWACVFGEGGFVELGLCSCSSPQICAISIRDPITDFLAKVPSGLPRSEFQDLTYKVRRYELPQFLSPFINQHMCTTLCISNHISVTAPTCFGVCRHHHHGDQCHCKFFAIHQMITTHHRLCLPDVLSAYHETVSRFSIVNPTRSSKFSNLFYFWDNTLHVSDGLYVHHQEFKTVHTATGVCTILNSWLWTERPSETCRVLCKNT